jgi:transcriptional regulator with XRE-family HTH domain
MVSLSRTSIANIEKGRQNLLLHHFVDIAEALQVELSDLVPPRKQEGREAMQRLVAALPADRRDWVLGALAQRSTKGRK